MEFRVTPHNTTAILRQNFFFFPEIFGCHVVTKICNHSDNLLYTLAIVWYYRIKTAPPAMRA